MRIISGKSRGTKLYTLEGLNTRPTLDRIKEPLFSIIQARINDANVLDLFAGSGALGLEALSRGAKSCTFCDSSYKAANIIKMNIEKTKMNLNSNLIVLDYKMCLKKLKNDGKLFDIIFIDPPYNSELIFLSVKEIIEMDLLDKDGLIIAETDDEETITNKINSLNIEIMDTRKYGRVTLLFIKRKG